MTLLARYAASLRARGLSHRTVENYCFGLHVLEDHSHKRFTSTLDVQLCSPDVWTFLEDRSEDLSAAYLRQIVSSAKSWHKWGHSRELWPLNGITSIPSPRATERVRDALSPARVLWLTMNAAGAGQRKLVMLGLWAGCRIGESAAMDDDCWKDDRLGFAGKGSKYREVPLAAALRDYRELVTRPYSLRQMRWHYESFRKRSPFAWTPHQLRATFAQRMLDVGVELAVVEALLGHVPKSMTLRAYALMPWDRKVEAVKKLRVL